MPATLTYPGLYVEEIPSGVHTIAGATTSVAAFIDFFPQGPVNTPVQINSVADFNRTFGGYDTRSESSYGIPQFFLNGGQTAWVVRIGDGTAASAILDLPGASQDSLSVSANSPGVWGETIQVGVDDLTRDPAAPATHNAALFNLTVRQVTKDATGKPQVVATEIYRNLTMVSTSSQYAPAVINPASSLIVVTDMTPSGDTPQPPKTTTGDNATSPSVVNNPTSTAFTALGGSASDGKAPTVSNYETALTQGSSPLDTIAPATFNILCLPGAATLDTSTATTNLATVIEYATTYCHLMNAFLIVDTPAYVAKVTDMTTWMSSNDTARDDHAAVYFPQAQVQDPLNASKLRNATSGTLAGIYARTDANRGVWKAPAGTECNLLGASIALTLSDADSGTLNPLGINTLRNFPIFGSVVWGARTLDGADQIGSDYKYIPVRRMANYIEESLIESLKWVVFEPNSDPLWAQIRLNVGSFMQTLFRQGAFQGTSPSQAYFVKCDSDTTTQTDINNGIVNIVVAFAPLQPAEFVVIQIQQISGQSQ